MKLFDQVKDFVAKNPSRITDGLSKVTDQIDKRTNGKYADKLEKVTSTVEDKIGSLSGEADIDLVDETESVDLTDTVNDAVADTTTDTTADDVTR